MNHKKIVKYHISGHEQYYGEFHENTKLWMLRSYFKDVSHFKKFKFIYNGETLDENKDELMIKEFIRGSQSYEVFFKVSLQNVENNLYSTENFHISAKSTTSPAKFYSLPNLSSNNSSNVFIQNTNEILIKENFNLSSKVKEVENELNLAKDQNENLINLINDLNDKVSILQKAYDNSTLQNYNYNRIIEQIKIEYKEKESNSNQTKEKLEKYQQQNLLNINNRKSILIDGRRKSINVRTEQNIKTDISIKAESNQFHKRKSSVLGRLIESEAKPEFIPRKSKLISSNQKKVVLDPNRRSMHSVGVISDFKEELLKKTNLHLYDFKPIKSDSKSYWNTIFKFLTKSDQLCFSLTNKDNFKHVDNYWYDLTSARIENINNTLVINKQQYDLILDQNLFQLSASTNTALRLLDQSKYLEIFSNDNSYFKNNKILSIYQLLFQFTKILPDNLKCDQDEFINKIKVYFSDNSSNKLSLVFKSLALTCDFSDINMERIKEISFHYDVNGIDCGVLGKICKTTGIIAFFVKDAMIFCGLETVGDKKSKSEAKDRKRASVIKDNLDIKQMKTKSEKTLKFLDELLGKITIQGNEV